VTVFLVTTELFLVLAAAFLAAASLAAAFLAAASLAAAALAAAAVLIFLASSIMQDSVHSALVAAYHVLKSVTHNPLSLTRSASVSVLVSNFVLHAAKAVSASLVALTLAASAEKVVHAAAASAADFLFAAICVASAVAQVLA